MKLDDQDAFPKLGGSPMPVTCSRCDGYMKIKMIIPTLLAQTVDDIVYVCPSCGIETKKTVQRAGS